jgi:hypothetical protein
MKVHCGLLEKLVLWKKISKETLEEKKYTFTCWS